MSLEATATDLIKMLLVQDYVPEINYCRNVVLEVSESSTSHVTLVARTVVYVFDQSRVFR